MSHWWRAYDEAVDDPKLILLSDKAHRAWFNLMCLASAHGGLIPPIEVVAVKLRMTEAKIGAIVDELVSATLLDEFEGTLRPHNWNGRQYKSDVSTERVKRFRERFKSQERNVSETPPDTESETDTDSEKNSSLRSESARTKPFEVEFNQFWEVYPHKVGKQAAYKSLVSVMKSGRVSFVNLMAGLAIYANKTDDRPWCNPATWLNQGRWDDQPAPEVRNARSVVAAADRLINQFGGVDAAKEYVPGSSGPAPLSLDFSPGQTGLRLIPKG